MLFKWKWRKQSHKSKHTFTLSHTVPKRANLWSLINWKCLHFYFPLPWQMQIQTPGYAQTIFPSVCFQLFCFIHSVVCLLHFIGYICFCIQFLYFKHPDNWELLQRKKKTDKVKKGRRKWKQNVPKAKSGSLNAYIFSMVHMGSRTKKTKKFILYLDGPVYALYRQQAINNDTLSNKQ